MFSRRPPIPEMEQRLIDLESEISRLRAEQVVLVNELDRAQAPQTDGSRSLAEWVQSRVDIAPDLARDLVFASRTFGHHRWFTLRFSDGDMTFDRAVATTRYAVAGADRSEIRESLGRDLAGLARLTAGRKRMTRHDERSLFAARYVTAQPTLDRSTYRIHGQLPGIMGHTFEKAMIERADELHAAAPDVVSDAGQRRADAVVAMAQDSLDRGVDDAAAAPGGDVTVFVDATRDDAAETGAEIAFGARIGPAALEQLVCTGSVRVVGVRHGRPVATTDSSRAIPPAVRALVMHRDGGCSIDGCRSRYRLQPHHIVPWSEGGTHHPDNLTMVCWYHHHVAIHGDGYRIDPGSPPHRRRLIRTDRERNPRSGAGPP